MKEKKKKISLTTQIFAALILGCLCGVLMHYVVPSGYVKDTVFVNGIFYVVGNGFIRLMKMLVVPLVFCSLVCGSMAMGDTKSLGKIGVKALLFYLVTTALAISVALAVGHLINPGIGLDISGVEAVETSTAEAVSTADTILNIIPENPIAALANGEMLQVIVFALFVGILIAKLGERVDTVANFFSQFNDVMMEMTSTVMSCSADFGAFWSYCKDIFRNWVQCIFATCKIHDRSIVGACNPMLWCISDFDEGIDWSESNKVPEEICSGYELCIFNSNIKRNDSVVY